MSTDSAAEHWWGYVTHTAGIDRGVTQDQVARRVDVSGATVNRWQDRIPKPETVAQFARAYDRPVLEAFIAAGFLTDEEAGQTPTATPDPAGLSDDELIAEVSRRIRRTSEPEPLKGEQRTNVTKSRREITNEVVDGATGENDAYDRGVTRGVISRSRRRPAENSDREQPPEQGRAAAARQYRKQQ